MIDAVDLVLLENREQFAIERARRSEIGTKRLLDDHAPPGAVLFPSQTGFAQVASDRRKARRRGRQIEQTIAPSGARPLDALEFIAERLIGARVFGRALQVSGAGEQFVRSGAVDLPRRELAQAVLQVGSERIVRHFGASNADQRKVVGQGSRCAQIVKRRH